MASSRKIVIAGVVLIAVLLLGFLPQYREASRLRRELNAAHQENGSLQWKLKLAGLRDQIGLVYLETNQKNYGIAQQNATQFFVRAREVAGEAREAGLKSVLETALQQRDEITAGLAKGDESVRDQLEKLYRAIHEGTWRTGE